MSLLDMKCSKGLSYAGLPTNNIQMEDDLLKVCAGIDSKPALKAHRAGLEIEGDSSSTDNREVPRVEVKQSPNKGHGLFAIDTIPAFSRLLEDDALLSLAQGEDLPQLWEKYCALPEELKTDFDLLSYPDEMEERESNMISKLEQRGYSPLEAKSMARVNSRWQANAFKTGQPNIGSSGSHQWAYSLFTKVARINHSCTPNACAHYRPSGVEVVHALRDIKADDEIEIAYFDLTMPWADRQARAKAWGFQCSCPACSDSGEDGGIEYEQRLSYVHRQLSTDRFSSGSDTVVEAVQVAIYIAHSDKYPWLVIALPKLYLKLFNLKASFSDEQNQLKETLQKVLEWEEKITGHDSPTSQQRRQTLRELQSSSSIP